ncbi:MAG: J domain-containing protein [Pseudomonadota bacterium]
MFSSASDGIEVSIRMLDGATLRGVLSPSMTGTLESVLSKETPFLEFVSRNGQRKFLAKHQIAYVEPVEPLKKLVLAPKSTRFIDAFTLLGLERPCTLSDAKAAYHAKARLYHPDVFAGQVLPDEVLRYVTDMFRQVNTAFTEVRSELEAVKAA